MLADCPRFVFADRGVLVFSTRRTGRIKRSKPGKCTADVAQLVEHHLAKVRVASSNLVVRSEKSLSNPFGEGQTSIRWSGREARQRTANPCTRVQIPSPPRAVGAVVARFLDTEEVASSNLASPTEKPLVKLVWLGVFAYRPAGLDMIEHLFDY